jgi:hypothetical protein
VLRVLGLVHVAAFGSFAWQVLPLLGDPGLPPLARENPRLRESLIRLGWLEPGDPGAPERSAR